MSGISVKRLCWTETAVYEKKGSYYYIGQFSRWIRPGAVRIGCSRYCPELEVTAFRNPDGTTAAVPAEPERERNSG